jgi:endonuclease III
MDIKERVRKTMSTLEKTSGKTMLASLSHLDPWKILITTILSARAKDETTMPISLELFRKYPTPEALASAKKKDVISIIKPIGFYRNKSRFIMETSRIISQEYGGKVPDDIESLLKLPGVGRKVANCELVYAFRKPAIPVDTHVHRVANRLGWVRTKDPEKTESALLKIIPKRLWIDINEYFVIFGKTICRPIGPKHDICPIRDYCDFYRKVVLGKKR